MTTGLRWFAIDELIDLAGRADKCADLCSGLPAEYYRTFATSAENLAALLRDLERHDEEELPGVREALSG